jgi:hypothetical protein
MRRRGSSSYVSEETREGLQSFMVSLVPFEILSKLHTLSIWSASGAETTYSEKSL